MYRTRYADATKDILKLERALELRASPRSRGIAYDLCYIMQQHGPRLQQSQVQPMRPNPHIAQRVERTAPFLLSLCFLPVHQWLSVINFFLFGTWFMDHACSHAPSFAPTHRTGSWSPSWRWPSGKSHTWSRRSKRCNGWSESCR